MNIESAIIRELSCALQAEQSLRPRDHSYIHASAIGDCRRKQAYRLIGEEGLPDSSHFLAICDVGHGVHARIQDRLVNVLRWVLPENIERKLFDEEYGIGGTMDALTMPLTGTQLWPDGPERFTPFQVDGAQGPEWVIDIKTITARARLFRNPKTGCLHSDEESSFESLTQPKKDHLLQTHLYSWMAKRMGLVDDHPDILLLYIGKDVAHDSYPSGDSDGLLAIPYKVFVQQYDQSITDEALKRARDITSAVEKGKLPKKDFKCYPGKLHWRCCTCAFRKKCWAEEKFFDEEIIQLTPSAREIIEDYKG